MSPKKIEPHSTILFQGDSITDAGRDRGTVGPNLGQALGFGYPRWVAEGLWETHPESYLQIYNRGISGDRILTMENRWENDCLRLLPDLISILIGVNDTWNYLYTGLGSSPSEYRLVFARILDRTLKHLPDVKLVLCEPFILITGEVTREWQQDISLRQQTVRELAEEYNAVFVPFQSALQNAARSTPEEGLLDDGVHPTAKGHRLLAKCWLEALLD